MNDVFITVVGNAVADPQLSATRSGIPFTTFRIASTSRRYDREMGAWTKIDTMFLDVRCWRGLALNAAATLVKGSPVVVQGRLSVRTVVSQGPDGERRRTFTDLDANAIGLDLARLPVESAGAGSRDEGSLAVA